MTELFNAIYTHYLTTALAGSLSAFHNTLAPEKAIFPYGVYQIIGDTPDWTYSEDTETVILQINLFSKTVTSEELCTLFGLLKTAFDKKDIVIDNYVWISCIRLPGAILTRVEKVWQYNVTYEIEIGKKT